MKWLGGGEGEGGGGGGHGGDDRLGIEGKYRGMEERGGKNSGKEEKEGKYSAEERGGEKGEEKYYGREKREEKYRGSEEREGKCIIDNREKHKGREERRKGEEKHKQEEEKERKQNEIDRREEKQKGKEEIRKKDMREERGERDKEVGGKQTQREERSGENNGGEIRERKTKEEEENYREREMREGKTKERERREDKSIRREEIERKQNNVEEDRERKGKYREEEMRGEKTKEEKEERQEKSVKREEIEEKHNKTEMREGKIKEREGREEKSTRREEMKEKQNKTKTKGEAQNKIRTKQEKDMENKEKYKEKRENKDKYKEIRGCGSSLFLLLLIMGLVTAAAAAQHNPFDDDDDELSFALNQLYRDSEAAMDPHNMLPEPGGVRHHGRRGYKTTQPRQEDQEEAAAAAGSEGKEEGASSPELNNCIGRLVSLQNSLEEEQATSLKLQKMLAKEGVLDLQAFYRRAVQHLWNTLRLQEVRDILKEGDTALVRQVAVRVTLDHWEGLDNYLRTEADPHKVDEFLQHGFTLETPASESSPSLLQSAITLGHAVIHAGKSLEVWLCVLCGGFVALAVWAVVLFVRDIQKELRWGSVLWMMAAVVFFICCLWHWRHMYKMAESRRHAELARRGYAGIPEECQPGARSSAGTVYDWVKVNFFGSPDVCDKYFEQLMVDATEEITPGMVIAETVSRFLFQPLQHLGTESGKLTTNFYKNVPPAYHLHATALFLGLLVVVLFYGCAYGIDFPLGLGGYRPMARQDSMAVGDRAGLGREAVEQLNRDREKFLEESRRMLTDITKAAEGTKGPQQQLVVTSSGILEAQLERLISRHLDRAMEQQQQGGASADSGVHTITSTPLRPHGTTKAVVQLTSPGQQSPSPLADLSSSSSSEGQESPGPVDEPGDPKALPVDEPRDPKALPVAIDAVHRRVQGRPAVSILPPRNPSRPGSTNTSAATTPSASEAGSPASRRKKGSRFLRMFRSAEAPPSPPPSPSASTQSLGNTGLDEPDLGVPPDSDSFLAEVRSVLDLSANSGQSSPTSPPSQD